MADVKPLAAIRFDPARTGGDLSAVIAPPYDVLDQTNKDALLARHDRNIVAIDLPHVPPKSAGPPEAYDRSARMLKKWLRDGTLIRESSPAIYAYHQAFRHDGRSFTRRKFIARVRLQPFADGVILPHEKTFGGPKEDRLALMKASRCQLSPIFGLYADPEGRLAEALETVERRSLDLTGTLDDVDNRVWIATDPALVDTVVSAMADKRIYIADGHHRYGTALLYRDWLAEQHGGALPNDHPAHFVMFVLASMNDPGCLILPYHRALANVDVSVVLEAWSSGTAPAAESEADIRVVDGRTGDVHPLSFVNRGALATLEPDQCEPWRKLDYAYLHRYLIDELLAEKLGKTPDVRYVKSAADAKRIAREKHGAALLVNATPMAHLRAVSEAGGLMPQKSTYFFPKLATGLTINPLE